MHASCVGVSMALRRGGGVQTSGGGVGEGGAGAEALIGIIVQCADGGGGGALLEASVGRSWIGVGLGSGGAWGEAALRLALGCGRPLCKSSFVRSPPPQGVRCARHQSEMHASLCMWRCGYGMFCCIVWRAHRVGDCLAVLGMASAAKH